MTIGAVAEAFRSRVSPFWNAAVEHRFVAELADGTLADTVLADYLVQDYQFVDDFVRLLGQCVASADDMEPRMRFARQLGFIATSEDDYFHDAFAVLGVPRREQRDPAWKPATTAFAEIMREALATRSYAHALTVLVVAEGLYLDWAERASKHGTRLPERPEHRRWFELHRGEDFIAWVEFLGAELDRVGSADDSELAELFARAVRCELDFFDDAYRDYSGNA